MRHFEQYKKPDGLNRNQEALLDHLIDDEAKLNNIEKTTREQAASQEWNAERKFHFGLQLPISTPLLKGKEICLFSKQSASSQAIYFKADRTWENL